MLKSKFKLTKKDTPLLLIHFIRPTDRRRFTPTLSSLRFGWQF